MLAASVSHNRKLLNHYSARMVPAAYINVEVVIAVMYPRFAEIPSSRARNSTHRLVVGSINASTKRDVRQCDQSRRRRYAKIQSRSPDTRTRALARLLIPAAEVGESTRYPVSAISAKLATRDRAYLADTIKREISRQQRGKGRASCSESGAHCSPAATLCKMRNA